jgi:beta-carotene ketolase (CrtW type)
MAAWIPPLVGSALWSAWALCIGWALFFLDVAARPATAAMTALALQWLFCGLFITAHDACHGSAAPGRPRLNRALGRLSAASYAAFSFERLRAQHGLHHQQPGSAHDPDFADVSRPGGHHFWPWALRFFGHYVSLCQLLRMVAISQVLLRLGHVPMANVLCGWALPSALSAVQLFAFGTYLPHRPDPADPFADGLQARNTRQARPVALLACYFFGYHHVHHQQPRLPWFALPSALPRPQTAATARPPDVAPASSPPR